MMSDLNLDTCGSCLDTGVQQTPVTITNPPGQPAIAYRVGTYAQFKSSMLARLKDSRLPALRDLRTRDDADFSIALLDAWAMAADVLTFYSERIVNESYRSTATERSSLRELARLVNYPLRPGVAANTYLAFTVEDAPGAPQYANIDIGTKVQSLPNPGEEPQLFETIEPIEARAEWNAMTPPPQIIPLVPQQLYKGKPSLLLAGTTANLQPGDALLIIEQVGGNQDYMFRRVKEAKVDTLAQSTQVTLEDDPRQPEQPEAGFDAPRVFVMRTRAGLFGSNAPDWKVMPDQVHKAYIATYNDVVNAYNRRPGAGPRLPNQNNFSDWPFPFIPSASSLELDRVYPQLLSGSWCIVVRRDGTTVAATIASVAEVSVVEYATSARVTRLTLNATSRYTPASMDDVRSMTIYVQSEELLLANVPPSPPPPPTLVAGESIRVLGSSASFQRLEGRTIVVTGMPSTTPGTISSEIAQVNRIDTDQQSSVLTLHSSLANQYIAETVTINANLAMATQGETVQDEILGSGDASQPYQRFTLRQAPLTYIQDSTQPTGNLSTLTVQVDGIVWKEVPTLFGCGPREHVYVTSIADDGIVTVQFGNGYNAGSRLTTGEDNVIASYRKGIGKQGLVQAGQLSLLITRPLGVKGVTNPFPASGAIDPETAEDARLYADNTVLTLGLIVSIKDYETFAVSYASVAKAQATEIWNYRRKCIVVTIAGPPTPDYPYGTVIETDSGLYEKIYTGMYLASDPSIPLTLQSYNPASFQIDARINVNPTAPQDRVLRDVEQALRSKFSFSARAFGQDVTSEEVTAALQRVPDVAAVLVKKLYRRDPSSNHTHLDTDTHLYAARPLLQQDGSISQAELLLVDPILPIGQLEVIW